MPNHLTPGFHDPGDFLNYQLDKKRAARKFFGNMDDASVNDAPVFTVFIDDFSDAATSNNWATTGFGTPPPSRTFNGSDAKLTIHEADRCFAMYRGFDATTLEIGDSITLSEKAYMSVSSDWGFRVGIGYSAGGIVDSTV